MLLSSCAEADPVPSETQLVARGASSSRPRSIAVPGASDGGRQPLPHNAAAPREHSPGPTRAGSPNNIDRVTGFRRYDSEPSTPRTFISSAPEQELWIWGPSGPEPIHREQLDDTRPLPHRAFEHDYLFGTASERSWETRTPSHSDGSLTNPTPPPASPAPRQPGCLSLGGCFNRFRRT